MKKFLIIILAFVLFMVMTQVTEASKLKTSFIPANTQWVIHLDMDQFLSTQIAQLILTEHPKEIEKAKQEILKELKLDPQKDIKSVTVFGHGKSEKNAVVCIQGNFDKKHILSLIQKEDDYKKSKYGKYVIHTWDCSQYGVFARDDLVIISQKEESLKNVLDVMKGKKKNIKSVKLFTQLNDIPREAFLRAVVSNVSELAGMHSKAVILKHSGAAFFIAMEKKGYLKIKLKLTTGSSETAQNIDQMVKGLLAMGKMGAQEKEFPMDIIESLQTDVKGKVVQLEFRYPSEKLFKILMGQKKLKKAKH